jgi:hypothetical protein
VSHQRFAIEALGIERRFWGVYARGLWIHVVNHVGMGLDEVLVPMLGFSRASGSRSLFGVDLSGASLVRMRDGSAWTMRAGSIVSLPGRGVYRSRIERSASPSLSMIVEIDRAIYASPQTDASCGTVGSLAAVERSTRSLCEAIAEAWCAPSRIEGVQIAVQALLASLRAEGAPLPVIDCRALPRFSSTLQALQRAVDGAMSIVGSRPMLVDVEQSSSFSARTLQRAMPQLCTAWGQGEESFRGHVQRTQLGRACGLMTDPRVTTELASRLLGFSSPNALCRAMSRYGLPSPGAVRERFAALS